MRKPKIGLIFLAVILFVGALIALSNDEKPENVLPSEGLLLCEIEGQSYYYNTEYLFKITSKVFPEEPTALEKKHAVLYEMAYREMVNDGAYISVDRVENEIKERRGLEKAAEDSLADPECEGADRIFYENYLAMLNACAEKSGTITRVFWDDHTPYVEKGLLITTYCGEELDIFWKYNRIAEVYTGQLFADYESLAEKYNVTFLDEDLK